MKILIACEFSGIVRDAFAAKGHDATSCDLLPSERPGKHYQGDVLDVLYEQWDAAIMHPPCTYLTCAANKWHKPEYVHRFPNREQDRILAVDFFILLANAPIPRICLENPKGIMSSRFRKPDQIIHPYHFGDPEQKETHLWLKGFPRLEKTNVVEPQFITTRSGIRCSKIHYNSFFDIKERADRSRYRSRTFPGIALAMAEQWG